MRESDDALSLNELIMRARSDLRSAGATLRAYQASKSVLRDWVGSELDNLLQSPDAAEKWLLDADPKKRIVALLLCRDYWSRTDFFLQQCELLAFRDTDQIVRGIAL